MIEGKTKVITPLWEGSDVAVVTTKNDITAGDGAKHDIMHGKAELATRTTCNVFEYLRAKGIPVAYVGRGGPTTFLTRVCEMIPVEVVVRRIAFGSYCKRNAEIPKGYVFDDPVIEFFYKTTGKNIDGRAIPCDDPLMKSAGGDYWDLYRPDIPLGAGHIGRFELPGIKSRLDRGVYAIAEDVNRLLKDAWRYLDGTLYDFKLEFGVLPDGDVVLADVVDCDSWRVKWRDYVQLSKQGYRDGDDLEKVLGVYQLAAALTDQLVHIHKL